jgi:O-antigen/teichoic acid export membrane protein
MSKLRKRVLAGVAANASGQVVTTVTQLLSLPLFLYAWSIEQYGEWLLLSAIPGYFSLADVGMGAVAMNKMTMLSAQERRSESNEVFQTAFVLIVTVTGVLFLLALAMIWTLDMGPVTTFDSRSTLSLLILVALLNIFSGLFDAVFRASGQFATGTYFINAGRLVEWGGGIWALMTVGSMLSVAAGFLVARTLVTIVLIGYARRRFPEFAWGTRSASRKEFRELLAPAISFLAFPLGNAITIQGMTILVGSVFGPAALAVFNTYRTISRLPVQLLAMFSRSLWPEISRGFGNKDYAVLRRMYRHGTVVASASCGLACVILYLAGGLLVHWWSGGKVPYDDSVFVLFLLAAFGSCAWQVGQVVLTATNCHRALSTMYLGAAVASVMLAAMLPSTLGLHGSAISLCAFEFIMIFVSRRLVRIPLGES